MAAKKTKKPLSAFAKRDEASEFLENAKSFLGSIKGEKGQDGKDGKDADPKEVAELLHPRMVDALHMPVSQTLFPYLVEELKNDDDFAEKTRGPQGKPGKNGADGKDGKDAEVDISTLVDVVLDRMPKVKGKDGKDGSPDTPEQIIEKIHSSKNLIRAEKIEGFDAIQRRVGDTETNLRRVTTIGGQMFVKLKQNGTPAGQPQTLNFTNATITPIGDGGEVNITFSGGGFTELTATGTVDGSNAAFTFTQQPSYIVADGVWYRLNKGWTWSGSTATLSIPPTYDVWGVA